MCGIDSINTQANHIKSWIVSNCNNNQEQLDLHNGLMLIPNHDYLFDKDCLSFTDQGNL